MLQEAAHQFDILDSQSDLGKYKVLILPDNIPVNDEFADKIDAFIKAGGAVLATFESGLDKGKNRFILDCLGVEKNGDGPIHATGELARGKIYGRNNYVEYLIPSGDLAKGLNATEHVMYAKGLPVKPKNGAEVLLFNTNSYFDRTYDYFCSHRQTPSSGKQGNPAIVRNGRCIYMSHPIFTGYNQRAPKWYKQLFLNTLDLILKDPVLKIEGPSSIISAVNMQEASNRLVLHLLHYIPEARGIEFDTIEDVIPVYNVRCSVRKDRSFKKVRLVPENKNLRYKNVGDRIEVVIPELNGHQMVEMSW
jgi:hypothetical protein